MKRWWAAAALFAVALGVAAFAFGRRTSAVGPADPVSGPGVPLAVARYGDFVERLAAQGRAGPPAGSTARVAFAGSGIVASVDVRPGEAVAAGAALAELDPAPLAAAVAQAQADVDAARAGYGGGVPAGALLANARAKLALAETHVRTLEASGEAASSDYVAAQSAARQAQLRVVSDRQNLERAQLLFNGGVAPAKAVDAARNALDGDAADARAAQARLALAHGDQRAALEAAQADLAGARSDVAAALAQGGNLGAQLNGAVARLRTAQINAANGVLRAPAAGVVLAVLHHPGEAVDPTQPVVDVGPPDAREATLSVPADRAGRIAAGDPVEFTSVASTAPVRGRVTAVLPVVDAGSQTATVVATGIPPGSIAGTALAADIEVATRRGILVPASAVVEDPQSGVTVVFVAHQRARGPSFEQRPVRVVAGDRHDALIGSGLRAGERVAAQGGYELLAPPGG